MSADSITDDVLARASRGDSEAQTLLFDHYRKRLRHMVALRLDPRLGSRLDPSDVVQEALVEAFRLLPEYLEERPLPLYPWLRQIAFNRMLDAHRRHLLAQKRSLRKEEHAAPALTDASVAELANRLVADGTSPSGNLHREEQRLQVQAALLRLSDKDRELLGLRYLEKLPTAEIAAVMGVSEGAVKVRHIRALERLRPLLGKDFAS